MSQFCLIKLNEKYKWRNIRNNNYRNILRQSYLRYKNIRKGLLSIICELNTYVKIIMV